MSNESSFYEDYKLLRSTDIQEFEQRMYNHLVDDSWETFGDMFSHGTLICQQLIKYKE